MRLRCAVPKTPAKSSVPPGSPLNKPRSLSTRSESTLPQTLIPLDFISFISNVYRKPGRRDPVSAQKFVDSSLAASCSCAHALIPVTLIPSALYFITRGYPGGWGISGWDCQSSRLSFLAASRGSPVTNHRPRVTERGPRITAPLVPRYRCAQTRKVPESRQLLEAPPGNISAPVGV